MSRGAQGPWLRPGHQRGWAEEAPPCLSCQWGPFLRTLNQITHSVLRMWMVLRSLHQHYPSLLSDAHTIPGLVLDGFGFFVQ